MPLSTLESRGSAVIKPMGRESWKYCWAVCFQMELHGASHPHSHAPHSSSCSVPQYLNDDLFSDKTKASSFQQTLLLAPRVPPDAFTLASPARPLLCWACNHVLAGLLGPPLHSQHHRNSFIKHLHSSPLPKWKLNSKAWWPRLPDYTLSHLSFWHVPVPIPVG